MAYSQTDLDALKQAIGEGVLEVQYSDKKVTYRTLHEMLQIKRMMENDLNGNGNSGRKFASFSKGL